MSKKNTLLRVIPTMTFLSDNLSGISIWHSYLAFYLALYLTFYLAFLSGILIWHSYLAFFSGILSGIPSGILIWHSYLAFFSGILSGTLSDVLSGILSGISFGILSGGWGPAGNTWRGFSRLRSGREHWAWILAGEVRQEHWARMVAVEVRQGTLGVDSRGWGPAGNTWRGFSRLRSGRENLAWMVVVEVRQGTLGVDGRGWGSEEAEGGGRRRKAAEGGGRRKSTDIKSNNPHLAGGEQDSILQGTGRSIRSRHDFFHGKKRNGNPMSWADEMYGFFYCLELLVLLDSDVGRCPKEIPLAS